MSLAVLRFYLECALLLAVGLGLVAGMWRLGARPGGTRPAARWWLHAAYASMVAAFALPALLAGVGGPQGLFRAPVQVWSRTFQGQPELALALTALVPAPAAGAAAVTAPNIGEAALLVAAVLLVAASAAGLGHLAVGVLRLRRACRGLTPFREIGRVSLCVAEPGGVAFSAWVGGRVYVAVPEEFVLDPARLRLLLAHELRHVRARDTGWAYVTALVRALFPWHPAAHAWGRFISRLQELACDQQLVARGRVSAREYGDCLVWAAERVVVSAAAAPAAAVPMLGGSLGGRARATSFLARRIEMLLSAPGRRARTRALAGGGLSLAVLALSATLAHGTVADRRLSRAQVQAMADRAAAASPSGFRVPVDETVVAEVNRVLGRDETRQTFREGLDRMRAHRSVMLAALARHGVPAELLAIPMVESRFQSLPEAQNRMRSAGIWQFIPNSARRFGLKVDATVDERLDPPRETEAAATYLAQNHARFGDWPLAIAAYNHGADRVALAVTNGGSRDAAALVQRRLLGPYSSAVLAAVLLMNAPELVAP